MPSGARLLASTLMLGAPSAVVHAGPGAETPLIGPALECRGVKSDDRAVRYELTVTALDGNSVVVSDDSTKEKCSCKFRHDGFFDQSKGMVPGYTVHMAYQSCDDACSRGVKRQIKAHISVTQNLLRSETYATPFVGDEISRCDRFSIDVPMLRRIEGQNIDRMDVSPESKARLKFLKGIGESESVPGQSPPKD